MLCYQFFVSYPTNVEEPWTYGCSNACETVAHISVMQGKDSADEKIKQNRRLRNE